MREYFLELPKYNSNLTPGLLPQHNLAYCLILFAPGNRAIENKELLREYVSILPWHLHGLQTMGAFQHLDVYVLVDSALLITVAQTLGPVGWPISRLLQFKSGTVDWWMQRLAAMRHPALKKYAGILHCDVGVLPRKHLDYDFAQTAAWDPATQPYAFTDAPLFPAGTYRESDMFWESVDKPENWKRFAKYIGDPNLRTNWKQNAERFPHYRIRGFHFGMSPSVLHAPEMNELLTKLGDIYEGDEGMISLYLSKQKIKNAECFLLPSYHLQWMPHAKTASVYPDAEETLQAYKNHDALLR